MGRTRWVAPSHAPHRILGEGHARKGGFRCCHSSSLWNRRSGIRRGHRVLRVGIRYGRSCHLSGFLPHHVGHLLSGNRRLRAHPCVLQCCPAPKCPFIKRRVFPHQQRSEVHQSAPDLSFEDLDLVLQSLDSRVDFSHGASTYPSRSYDRADPGGGMFLPRIHHRGQLEQGRRFPPPVLCGAAAPLWPYIGGTFVDRSG